MRVGSEEFAREFEKIRSQSQLLIAQLQPITDFDFGYTVESLDFLERYLDDRHQSGEDSGPLVALAGSFLGQAVAELTDCAWIWDPMDRGMILLKERVPFFPFEAVRKRLAEGADLERPLASVPDQIRARVDQLPPESKIETMDGAVAFMMDSLSRESLDELSVMGEDDLSDTHFGLGRHVRNTFYLLSEFSPVADDFARQTGKHDAHPDDISLHIVRLLWERLRAN